jgi:hypothetical protein
MANDNNKKQIYAFYNFINDKYDIMQLAKETGIISYIDNVRDSIPVYCPFHDDLSGGKRSACLYKNSNSLYCFSEQKHYYPINFLFLKGIKLESLIQVYQEEFQQLILTGKIVTKDNVVYQPTDNSSVNENTKDPRIESFDMILKSNLFENYQKGINTENYFKFLDSMILYLKPE